MKRKGFPSPDQTNTEPTPALDPFDTALLEAEISADDAVPTLDLHGLNREEARFALQAALNSALQSGHDCLKIIHGNGDILRKEVHKFLQEQQTLHLVAKFRPSTVNNQMAGVTVAALYRLK
ncbi:MAG: Smr/MutS family protein [Patescibacteria group bacterium]